jgi:hypothetical protein
MTRCLMGSLSATDLRSIVTTSSRDAPLRADRGSTAGPAWRRGVAKHPAGRALCRTRCRSAASPAPRHLHRSTSDAESAALKHRCCRDCRGAPPGPSNRPDADSRIARMEGRNPRIGRGPGSHAEGSESRDLTSEVYRDALRYRCSDVRMQCCHSDQRIQSACRVNNSLSDDGLRPRYRAMSLSEATRPAIASRASCSLAAVSASDRARDRNSSTPSR